MLVTTKAHEGDLVELTEDLPKYDLKRGQRGFVIEAFDEPNEAYDIEFEDEKGDFIGFAYSVRPDQIKASEKRKRKAYLRDVVELAEDLTEYGVKKDERAVVATAFSSLVKTERVSMNIPLGMKTRIMWSSAAAGAIGVPGAFGAHLDVVVITGIWATLLVMLADQAGTSLDKAKAAKIVAAILTGITLFGTGFKLANTYFAYTGIGTIPAVIANVGANASITYLFGNAAARSFLSEGASGPAQSIGANILAIMVSILTGTDTPGPTDLES